MSEYTFTLNAIDRASPVVEEAIQRIRAVLESGSAQLSEALRILPSFNQTEFDRLLQTLNQVGDQAVERARMVGQEIGQQLASGVGPGNAQFEQLGERLNAILRESLTQARAQIQQFSETTRILPGGTAAGDVLQFAEQWQQSMLRSIQTVAAELRTQLNEASRGAGLDPRAVGGQFQGARITAASSEALIGTLGTSESTDAFRLRMDQQRTGTSQAAAQRVAQAVRSTEEVYDEAVNRVVQGLAVTQEHLAELMARGKAFNLTDPMSRALTPISGPVGVRDVGQGGPSVYQLKPGEGVEYNPEQEAVKYARALQRATEVLDREQAAVDQAAAAEESHAVAASNLARLQQAEGSRSVQRVGRGGTAPYAEFGSGGAQFYETSGEPVGDQARITQLQRQLFGTLESEAVTEDRARTARMEAADAAQRTATNQATLARLLQDPSVTPVGNALRSGTGDFFERSGAPIAGDTPEGQLRIQTLQAQYQTLLQRRNTQMERLVAQQAESAGSAGLLNRFMGGAGGVGFDAHAAFKPEDFLGNIAGTAGVLARYGGTGIAITSGFKAFTELRTQIIDYQSALANLQEVLGATDTKQVDFNSAIAAAAPAGIGAADAINLGADAIARYREEIQGGASASTVMITSLDNIAQAAVLTGQTAKEAGDQLITATQGFGLGSSGQGRILDAVENARRNYGGDRSQILQAVSQSGDLAASAGVDPETLANMVALIQAHSGASGAAVASTIERTISRQGSSNFKQALGGLGIADTGNIVPEIEQMSVAWTHLSKTQQEALITQLGGARQARELLPLLEAGKGLLDANANSYRGVGAAADQYARQQNTIAGVIRQISGELKDFAQLIGGSGLFSFIGPLAIGFRDIVEAGNSMLRVFNALPAPIRDVALTLMEAVVAVRLFGSASQQMALGRVISGVPVLGGFARKVGLPGVAQGVAPEAEAGEIITGSATTFAETVVAAARDVAVELRTGGATAGEELVAGGAAAGAEQAAGGLAGAARGAETGAMVGGIAEAPLAGLEGGLAGTEALSLGTGAAVGSAALGLLTNPVTLAIGGLIAIGAVSGHMHQLDAATAKGADALNAMAGATDAQGYRTAADSLRAARQQLAKSSSGPFGSIAGLLSGTGSTEAQYSRDATYADSMAKRLAAEQGNASTLAASVFGPTNDIVSGLQTMASNGIDASTQLQAVAQALGLVTLHSGTAAAALAATAGTGGVPSGLTYSAALVGSLAGWASATGATGNTLLNTIMPPFNPKQGNQVLHEGDVQNPEYVGPGGQADLGKAIDKALGHRQAGDVLTDEDKNKIADAIVASYGIHGGTASQREKTRHDIRAAVLKQLDQYLKDQQQGGTGPLTDDALSTLLNGPNGKGGLLSTITSAQADAFDPTGGSGAGGNLQNAVAILRSIVSRADPQGTHFPELIAAYHQAEDKLAQATIGNLEKLRAAADAHAQVGHVPKIDQGYFDKEIQAAGDDTNQLIAVMNNMTSGQIALAESMLENAQKTALVAYQNAERLAVHLGQEDRAGVLAGPKAALDAANADLNAFLGAKQYATGAGGSSGSGGLTTAQQTQLAKIQAGADPNNQIQSDKVAVAAAQYQVDHLKKNTAEWWNAQKSLTDAQHQLSMDQAALSQAESQASIFPGSAMSAAAAQIAVAKSQVAAAEKGTTAWYQAQRALTDAQIAYGNAVLADQANVRLLGGDMTDPVFRAAAQLQTDAAVLRREKRLKAPADVLHAQEVTVRNDAAALEAAKFQQRFQDAQTLHDLGQMSDAAYLRYLDAELERLEKIKHRTRQETDEMYQVEQALKAASDQMQGQWNLGNIKIPTPYEVKRYIAASAQGVEYSTGLPSTAGAQAAVSTTLHNVRNNYDIRINGADTAMVKAILLQLLGPHVFKTTSTTTRKV